VLGGGFQEGDEFVSHRAQLDAQALKGKPVKQTYLEEEGQRSSAGHATVMGESCHLRRHEVGAPI
jgi:hypothetical protein